MNEKKIKKYLETNGRTDWMVWTMKEFKTIISDPGIEFKGESTGGLRFNKSKSGRRYIEFEPRRCYID